MTHKQSQLPYKLEDTYILQFGTFYFYETFIVSEIKEGVNLDLHMINTLIQLIDTHYGPKEKIGYISNRIHNYSIITSAWHKIFKMRCRFQGYAVVPSFKAKSWGKLLNVFFPISGSGRFDTLLDAASWVTSITILKKHNKLKKNFYF